MVQQGGYTEVVVLTISHALAASGEAVALNATSPAGITVGFAPSSPVQVPASSALNVTLILTASSSATPANDTITVKGVSGTNSQSVSFTLRVVEYRVIMIHSTFSPVALNVTVGSTVYWQNLDGPAAGCGGGAATGGGPQRRVHDDSRRELLHHQPVRHLQLHLQHPWQLLLLLVG